MYTIILDQGIVVRDADKVIVSPAESAEDPKFIEYNNWVNNGGEPRVVNTASELEST